MKNKKFILTSLIVLVITILTICCYKPILKNINYGLDLKGGFEVLYKIEPLEEGSKLTDDMMKSTYKAISNRVDTLGVSEPEIIIEGDKIRVKLAGVTNEKEARDRLSTPAVLSFRNTSDELLMNASILTSKGAKLDYNSQGVPVVALSIKDKDAFYSVTKKLSTSSDNRIVIWLDFDETDSFTKEETTCGQNGNMSCISVASVKEAFSSDVIIEGGFTLEEAEELVDLINSGSLPTKLVEVSSKTVDASFGSDTLVVVAIAGVITLLIVFIIMISAYRFVGLLTGICLLVYSALVFLTFNLIDGVLTLPGIAALVLGVGMAVDSNIISFERIKDELRYGKSLSVSSKDGNKRSLITIIDANLTTFLVALVLFIFGESSVKGFATMLMITIFLTIVTMVFLNRYLIEEYVKSKFFDNKLTGFIGINKKNIVKEKKEEPKDGFEKLNFVKHNKVFFSISGLILIIGLVFGLTTGLNLGIDFTGGSDIALKSENTLNINDSNKVLKEYTIIDQGNLNSTEGYVKIKETLNKEEINQIKQEFKASNISADISVISNIVKKDLTKNAFISVVLACIGIMLYIAVRFNWNYGVGTIVSLVHDALIVVAVFAILHLEINFIFIAAILTIIGYSINDTIVCFDRMRENTEKLYKNNITKREELEVVVNRSIRQTLFRSLFTSSTTLVAVLVLIFSGANGILDFNLALLIGLIAGSYSSIFIAAQIWLMLETRNIKKPKKKQEKFDELEEKTIKGINS